MKFIKYFFVLSIIFSVTYKVLSTTAIAIAQTPEKIAQTWFTQHSKMLTEVKTKYPDHIVALEEIINLKLKDYKVLREAIKTHKITVPLKVIKLSDQANSDLKKRGEMSKELRKNLLEKVYQALDKAYDIEDDYRKIPFGDITLETRLEKAEQVIKFYKECLKNIESIKIQSKL